MTGHRHSVRFGSPVRLGSPPGMRHSDAPGHLPGSEHPIWPQGVEGVLFEDLGATYLRREILNRAAHSFTALVALTSLPERELGDGRCETFGRRSVRC